MADYKAPLKDMNYVLFDVFGADKLWQSMPAMAESVDKDTAQAILEECAKISEQEIAPLSRQGDETGVQLIDGAVKTAPGYQAAFNTYAEGGWTGLGGDLEYGGMGMPKMLTAMHEEMLCAADISFSLYPGLTSGAALSLAKHGSEELKQKYLTRMYAGEWAATMCLTEAHAGSDLGIIRTKAVPQDDGSYLLSGSKIFITGGDHDLTDNIIHLVLAKLPDAPAGSRGISLFLVPKFNVNDDGSLADRNGATVGSIEHKMGIHASATCVMNFDNAKGYLVGELNQGLACMFTMMNHERIGVGIQGIGAADRSYQNAVEYAKDRIQGRSLTGVKSPDKAADSIIVHADVRRMLLNMKALTEGSRALTSYISMQLDISLHGNDEERPKAEALAALMTPVAKAFFSDLGFESTVTGQQVFGGHGFIREWGQEQLVRDTRIAQIYEGTNGIQAMDLVGRKLAANGGKFMQLFIDDMNQFIAETSNDDMAEFIEPLSVAVSDLAKLTQSLLVAASKNPDELGSAACDYLHIFGYTAMAFVWAKMASVSHSLMADDPQFHQGKLITARYYFNRILPRRLSLMASAMSGAEYLYELDEDLF